VVTIPQYIDTKTFLEYTDSRASKHFSKFRTSLKDVEMNIEQTYPKKSRKWRKVQGVVATLLLVTLGNPRVKQEINHSLPNQSAALLVKAIFGGFNVSGML